jgi:hypothetical protein
MTAVPFARLQSQYSRAASSNSKQTQKPFRTAKANFILSTETNLSSTVSPAQRKLTQKKSSRKRENKRAGRKEGRERERERAVNFI